MSDLNAIYRRLPSVDSCLHDLFASQPGLQAFPRALLKELCNTFLNDKRSALRANPSQTEALIADLASELLHFVSSKAKPLFCQVLNGTGVVIHTNMGRAVFAPEVIEAITLACQGYSNLELNLATGERGSRYSHVEKLICSLTGAEAALVVNNNAAAVLITLNTLAEGREVIVSRGQLVEIGGSFRIPEVMTKSGTKLVEVGCTNRVHLPDYKTAINENTAALMRVHTSNYRIIGFHSEVNVQDLAKLAKEYGLPLIEDLGSGSLLSLPGLPDEPTVQSIVAAGAAVVTFSGDKVLGGPQAGIIVGQKQYIEQIKANPLNRALRIDKTTIAALEATLRLYLDAEQVKQRIPTLAMITASPTELKAKASKLLRLLRRSCGAKAKFSLVPGDSRVGGGAYPETDLPTTLLKIEPLAGTASKLKQQLLASDPPLLGRLENDAFMLDSRTLAPAEFSLVSQALAQAL